MAAAPQQRVTPKAFATTNARVKSLGDSVGTLSTRLDSLVASTTKEPVAVRVLGPLEVKDSPWDIAGVVLVPLVIVIVTSIVSMKAAKRGAREGAKATLEATTAGIREELRLEREHAIDRLHKRVKSNLRRVMTLAKQVDGHQAGDPLEPEVGEELEVIWNLYYRVMEPIFTIGAGDLAERLDAFFGRNHTLAETVKALEARSRDVTTVGHETEKYRDTAKARQALPGERQQVLDKIAKLGQEADGLLAEVLRIWPDPA